MWWGCSIKNSLHGSLVAEIWWLDKDRRQTDIHHLNTYSRRAANYWSLCFKSNFQSSFTETFDVEAIERYNKQSYTHIRFEKPTEFSHDVALLLLSRKVLINLHPLFRPACLPIKGNSQDVFLGKTGIITSWGNIIGVGDGVGVKPLGDEALKKKRPSDFLRETILQVNIFDMTKRTSQLGCWELLDMLKRLLLTVDSKA